MYMYITGYITDTYIYIMFIHTPPRKTLHPRHAPLRIYRTSASFLDRSAPAEAK